VLRSDTVIDTPRLARACTDLQNAAAAMLEDPQAIAPPVPEVARQLGGAYREIGSAANSCLSSVAEDDNARTVQARHLAAARQMLTAAGEALRPFGMKP
jgi:hypothetical protein